jgi:hypothetical protein
VRHLEQLTLSTKLPSVTLLNQLRSIKEKLKAKVTKAIDAYFAIGSQAVLLEKEIFELIDSFDKQ